MICGKSVSLTSDWQLIVDALIGSHTVKLWNSHWGRPVVVPGRWASFLALCGVLERAVQEGILNNYYLKGGVAMEQLITAQPNLAIKGRRYCCERIHLPS